MKKILAALIFPLSLWAFANQNITEAHLQTKNFIYQKRQSYLAHSSNVRRGVWGETWICPKASCGYENYVEIEYCALCGTKQT